MVGASQRLGELALEFDSPGGRIRRVSVRTFEIQPTGFVFSGTPSEKVDSTESGTRCRRLYTGIGLQVEQEPDRNRRQMRRWLEPHSTGSRMVHAKTPNSDTSDTSFYCCYVFSK